MPELRMLNERGMSFFASYLDDVRAGAVKGPPLELLDDPATSARIGKDAGLEQKLLPTRMDAAQYLQEVLRPLDRKDVDHNSGLWTWLSLFFFEQLCPRGSDGIRKVKATYRYLLPRPVDPEHFRHYYRHLLAGAYTTLRMHARGARLLLCGAIDKFDDFNEQVASRQELITNRSLVQTLDVLYFDFAEGSAKRGAAPNKRKPGTLRRLIDVVSQVDLTYDLYSMTAEEFLAVLPAEFDSWAGRSPSPNV
jgi:hypothetical protein